MSRSQCALLIILSVCITILAFCSPRVTCADECSESEPGDPCILVEGVVAPFTGVLMTPQDSAELVADVVSCKERLEQMTQQLDECLDRSPAEAAFEAVLAGCQGELERCLARDIETPWLDYVLWGGAGFGLGIVIGLVVGAAL